MSSQPSSEDVAFSVPREKALALVFEIKKLDPPKTTGVLSGPPGRVWQNSVVHSGPTSGIRIHVVVKSATAAKPWRLKVLDGTKLVEEFESSSTLIESGDFWTAEVPEKGAYLELWADGDPSGIRLDVDAYAFRVDPAIPQATVGDDDKQPIGTAPSDVKALAPPVAGLTIMTDLGGAYCTGFLITESLLMTNEHCVADQKEAKSTLAEFGYDSDNASKSSYRGLKLEAVEHDRDYAVVRMSGKPGSNWKRVDLDLTGIASDKVALAVVQHPEGRPKMAAVKDCKVDGKERLGRGGSKTDFGHSCDTLGGSSGSPVFLRSSLKVVGLHHLGFREGIDQPVNQGVHLDRILADIKERHPELAEEILATGAPMATNATH